MHNERTAVDKKILVMMSTYNGEKYVEDQINSILGQENVVGVDLLVRDDGSTDQTVNIIKRIQGVHPGRISLMVGRNVGSNASFFLLLKEANGYEYYALSDQDDIWLPNKLEVAAKWLENEDSSMPLLYASTSYLARGETLEIYGQTRKQHRPFTIYNTIIQNICPGHTQVFNNKLLGLLKKPIDVRQIYVYDAWITNVAMLFGRIIFNNDSHTLYRQHSNNQLGYGQGKLGRLMTSCQHLLAGDGKRYRQQIKFFVEEYQEELARCGALKTIMEYVHCDSLQQRIRFMISGKLYRQTKLESEMFYLAVVFNYM